MAHGHSQDFKQDAVRIALASGFSTLSKWVRICEK